MMRNLLIVGFVAILLTSCSTNENLYSWYNYDNITYEYNKKRTDNLQVKMLEEYEKIIQKQKGSRGVVPPGLYAEYGYMLYKSGKQKEGLSFMRQEIKRYPESEIYISRIIKQLEK